MAAAQAMRCASGADAKDAEHGQSCDLLIIHLFQLVFSVRIVFFSHNKSTNSIFQPAYQHNRTEALLPY
jgi:hypothetical protein